MAIILDLPVEVLQMILSYCVLDDIFALARTCSYLTGLVSETFSFCRAFWEPRLSIRSSLLADIPFSSETSLCSASVAIRFNTPDYSGRLQSDNFCWAMVRISPSLERFLRGLSSKLFSALTNGHKLILF